MSSKVTHQAHLLELIWHEYRESLYYPWFLGLAAEWSLNEAYFYLGNALRFIVTAASFSTIRFYNAIVFKTTALLLLLVLGLCSSFSKLSFVFLSKEILHHFPVSFKPFFSFLMWSKTKIWSRVGSPVFLKDSLKLLKANAPNYNQT